MKENYIRDWFWLILFLIKALIVSAWFNEGDQKSYIEVYEGITESISESLVYYLTKLNATVNVHFLLIYICKNLGLSKLLFSALSSFLLFFLWYTWLTNRLSYSKWYSFLILNTFYFDVLYFSAERLKIAVIFVGWFLIQRKFFFFITSVASHVQTLVLAPLWLHEKKSHGYLFILLTFLTLFFLSGYREYVLQKIVDYSGEFGGSISFKTVCLLIPLTLKRKLKLRFRLGLIAFFVILSFVVGDLRINIMIYLYLLVFVHHDYSKVIFFLLNGYFFFKTIGFLYNGYLFGTGF